MEAISESPESGTDLLDVQAVLDEPVRPGLEGAHAHVAVRHGRAVGYEPAVSPFVATPRDPAEWADAAALAGPEGILVVRTMADLALPPGWRVVEEIPGVHMVLDDPERLTDPPDTELVELGAADVEEMRALVARTRPGPFGPRTVELGTYLGVREGGALVAMAGERLHPPGATEISAVCTDPDHRGRGLATRLVRALVAGIRARGELPMLHAAASNTAAIALYAHLGFRLRARPDFFAVRVPEGT